ncbi:unnamed protein product [Pieris brassicae]|uniref:Uncharacterized protein n=1 Tax=Pieris brassicae TaxID=7116 RepID=A0A9P0TDH5_PIEBR|nr:unnamed protein product [Pieris brassicae]
MSIIKSCGLTQVSTSPDIVSLGLIVYESTSPSVSSASVFSSSLSALDCSCISSSIFIVLSPALGKLLRL